MDSLTDAGIANLQHLTKLKKLGVAWNDIITGSTFDMLPMNLEELKLIGMMYLTDAGIANLQQLTNLRKLKIERSSTSITGSTFYLLPSSLEELILIRVSFVTDAGIANLQHLTNLKTLHIESYDLLTNLAFHSLPTSILKVLKVRNCESVNESQ